MLVAVDVVFLPGKTRTSHSSPLAGNITLGQGVVSSHSRRGVFRLAAHESGLAVTLKPTLPILADFGWPMAVAMRCGQKRAGAGPALSGTILPTDRTCRCRKLACRRTCAAGLESSKARRSPGRASWLAVAMIFRGPLSAHWRSGSATDVRALIAASQRLRLPPSPTLP